MLSVGLKSELLMYDRHYMQDVYVPRNQTGKCFQQSILHESQIKHPEKRMRLYLKQTQFISLPNAQSLTNKSRQLLLLSERNVINNIIGGRWLKDVIKL